MKYTQHEELFLLNNYATYGAAYCAKYCNRHIGNIIAKAARMKLKVTNRITHPSMQNVSIDKFLNIDTIDIAYVLGYLWADGYIRTYTSNKGIVNWKISLEIVKDDAENIFPIMNRIGEWALHKRNRGGSWKDTWTFSTNNKDIYKFLLEHGYLNKSISEPILILQKIPNGLIPYFWKGVFDGDGSAGLVGRGAYFEIASTYEYKYSELDKWLKSIGTFGTVYRSISKRGHKSSVYKVYGKKIICISKALPEYGLERKTQKLKDIVQRFNTENLKQL